MPGFVSTDLLKGRIVRDKKRISTGWILLLLGIAILPLLVINLRLLAAASADPYGLLAVGEWLNSHVSLHWINHEDRRVVTYVLLLPMAAMLIAFTRLTLGIRILGFRSILIAIGFQEIGLLPSLLVITLVAGTVLLVRPAMRRSGMPLYARIAAIMCIVALTMLLGLFAGSWLNSTILWSMAFFPVVILAMLAESIAATFARDNAAMAAWRTGNTIVLAGIIAALSQVTFIRELVLSYPELLLTKLVLIVFLSEFLDLRLFEGFRPGSKANAERDSKQPDVVIVRNRFAEPPLHRTTPETPRRYQRAGLQPTINGLRDQGYSVEILEGDSSLAAKLRNLTDREHTPVVLNFAGGSQGAGRLAQVPTICEMLGLPYSGPGPQAAALLDDRKRQLQLLEAEGLRVPRSLNRQQAKQIIADSDNGVWTRARYQSDRSATTVTSARTLRRSLKRIEQRYGETLIEQIPPGRAVTVIVVAPEKAQPRVLPLLEGANHRGKFRALVVGERGWSKTSAAAVHGAAVCALRALDCKDLARVDLRCTNDGRVTISRVLAIEPFSSKSAARQAMALAGLAPADMAAVIMQTAIERWRTRIEVNQSKADVTSAPVNLKRATTCNISASSATA